MVAINREPQSVDEMRAVIDLATGEDCWQLFSLLADENSELYDRGSFWAGLVVGAYFMAVKGK